MFERVLITGAAGFIGSHLADFYVDLGADVTGVDNLTTGNWANFPVVDARHFTLDITDRQGLYQIANTHKPTMVFHCAASYSDPNLWHRDAQTNVLGSINAAIMAKHHQAKIAYFNTALPPISSYAISKIAGDQYIHMCDPQAITFRLANVYGPRNLSGPIPTFYRRLSEGFSCTIVRTRRELVYVKDLVQGVHRILKKHTSGTVDMCTGQPVTIKEIYTTVSEAIGIHPDAEEIDPPDDDVTEMVLDPTQAASLGWAPTTTIQEGIRGAIAWYRENGVGETYTHLRLK